MAEFWWKSTSDSYTEADKEHGLGESRPVDEQHPIPFQLMYRESDNEEWEPVNSSRGIPVTETKPSPSVWVSVPTLIPYGATSGALDANDAMGNKFYFQYGIEGRPLPRRGRILTIRRWDQSDVVLADTIHISIQEFTAAASDAAFTISVADSVYFLQSQTFPTGVDIGSAKVAEITDVNQDYYSPDRRLVCQESTTGTPTPTSGAMPIVQLFILPMGD